MLDARAQLAVNYAFSAVVGYTQAHGAGRKGTITSELCCCV